MVLQAAARDWTVPEPWFLECLTTMPFGDFFLDAPGLSLFFFSPATVNPDTGLGTAIDSLGWRCREWMGEPTTGSNEALEYLREATRTGPAIAGPVDLGDLVHNPRAEELRGGDHFVVVLSAGPDNVLFHDPYGYPFTSLPSEDFLRAWRADKISYKRGPYTLRFGFEAVKPATRAWMIEHTITLVREAMTTDPGGPEVFGGSKAVRRLSQVLAAGPPEGLGDLLAGFSIPIGARRRLDAARLFQEARRPELEELFEEQARLLGSAQLPAVKQEWAALSLCLEKFASVEDKIIEALND